MTEPEQTLTDRVVNIHTKRLVFGMLFTGGVAGGGLIIHRFPIIEKVLRWAAVIVAILLVCYITGMIFMEDHDD